jgi:hypothetical protein
MGRWTKLFELVGVNSIPVVGVLFGDWSNATALAVYWLENLIASLLVAARLWLHRRWQEPDRDGTTPMAKRPSELLMMAIPFTLAHGLFLGFVFVVVSKLTPDVPQLQRAALALLAFQGLAFGLDLWALGSWPAARVNERADHLMGRVVLVHLSIIIGMFLFMWLEKPGAFFGFFVGCKVLGDVTAFLPKVDPGTPEAPPRWLATVMRRFPRQNGESFDEYWRRTNLPPGTAAPKVPRPRWPAKRRKR